MVDGNYICHKKTKLEQPIGYNGLLVLELLL